MTATELLSHEHHVILKVLEWGEREIQRLQSGGPLRQERLEQALDFIRHFADRCHHAKEEKLLFQRLTQRGLPVDSGPVAAMLHEHELGRAYIAAVLEELPAAARGEERATAALQENLGAYIDLLRAHIQKEDNVLYPMADRLFSAADQQELLDDFQRVEKEEIGSGVHEKYHRLAEELAAEQE